MASIAKRMKLSAAGRCSMKWMQQPTKLDLLIDGIWSPSMLVTTHGCAQWGSTTSQDPASSRSSSCPSFWFLFLPDCQSLHFKRATSLFAQLSKPQVDQWCHSSTLSQTSSCIDSCRNKQLTNQSHCWWLQPNNSYSLIRSGSSIPDFVHTGKGTWPSKKWHGFDSLALAVVVAIMPNPWGLLLCRSCFWMNGHDVQ